MIGIIIIMSLKELRNLKLGLCGLKYMRTRGKVRLNIKRIVVKTTKAHKTITTPGTPS